MLGLTSTIGIVSVLLLGGCQAPSQANEEGCGEDTGLSLCVSAKRKADGQVIVQFVFGKTHDFNWRLRAGEPVQIHWLNSNADLISSETCTVIFSQAFQSGGDVRYDTSLKFKSPDDAMWLTASFGPNLKTTKVLIASR